MLLSNSDLSSENHIFFFGDFKLLLDGSLDAKSATPRLNE